MKVEKPQWLKTKEAHDAEIITVMHDGTILAERPRSRGCMYGPEESLVDQVGDGLINVNDIMKRFEKMPTAEELQAAGLTTGGFYGDFINAPDYEEALQITGAAKAQFALLPAHVRGRFENDPVKFLDFVSDPKNGEECQRMGLKKPKEPPKEPEVGLKDVRDAIVAGQGKKKTAGKGGEDEG
jgi:phage internal scaffolding protein